MTRDGSHSHCTTVLVGPFYTRREAARHAHLSAREVRTAPGLIRIDAALAVQEAYLAFQFDRAGIRPDLAEVVLRLNEHELPACVVADWIARSQPDLGNKSPLAWLSAGGRLDKVLTMAEQAAHENAG